MLRHASYINGTRGKILCLHWCLACFSTTSSSSSTSTTTTESTTSSTTPTTTTTLTTVPYTTIPMCTTEMDAAQSIFKSRLPGSCLQGQIQCGDGKCVSLLTEWNDGIVQCNDAIDEGKVLPFQCIFRSWICCFSLLPWFDKMWWQKMRGSNRSIFKVHCNST